MSHSFYNYFDAVVVINLKRRTDRAAQFKAEMEKIDVDHKFLRWFDAHDRPCLMDNEGNFGPPSGNMGCTASHRGVLEFAGQLADGWRTLVFEDDAELIGKPEDFWRTWEVIWPKIPKDWDILYLGGHYGEDVQERLNPYVLRTGRMLTTSSYAVTTKMARLMAPHICGIGPIDSLFGGFHRKARTYCIQPRLFKQRPGYSDLQDREMDNGLCMTDKRHESMLPTNYVGKLADYVPPPPRISAGRVAANSPLYRAKKP